MDLYLRNRCKAAEDAAAQGAASNLKAEKETGGTRLKKSPFPEVGASHLLDLPLGVKPPVFPGSTKLYQPSFDFNLHDPYCRLLGTSYQSLHDPHLKTYYKQKDIVRRLRKGGYLTSNNKVICSLRELNKYRHYLTTLKTDFERNYIREQKMIEQQVNKLYESKRDYDGCDAAQFQEWLLQEGKQATSDQKQLIKHRHLDINRELDKIENKTGRRSIVQIKEEERRHRDHIRRKLNLRRQIEEEWKTKEMLLLTKIGEEIRQEARAKEQRSKIREIRQKKQALLERKIAHPLQKMRSNDDKRERSKESTFQDKERDETASAPKIRRKTFIDSDQKSHQEHLEPKRSTQHAVNYSKIPVKKAVTFVFPQGDVQSNTTEKKKDEGTTKKSYPSSNREIKRTSFHLPVVSSKTSNDPRLSLPDIPKQEVSGKKTKKSIISRKTVQMMPCPDSSNKQQTSCQDHCQEKVTSEELTSIIHNIMAWVVAAVTSVLYPVITKYEERVQNNTYPTSSDLDLSSNSSRCCSTCSEALIHESYKIFQAEPCPKATVTPSEPSSAHKEKNLVKQSITSEIKHNETYGYAKLKSSKSDSHLFVPIKVDTKKSKEAATETEDLEHPLSFNRQAKAINEIQKLRNAFVNCKYSLKEETELILESIFQEMVANVTQAIPNLASVTAEDLFGQIEAGKGDLLSNVDISSAATEIVENMLEKLQCVVEKKCVEVFSQEDVSVHFKSDLTASGEHLISPKEKSLKASLPCGLENVNVSDIAEDMVNVILEKLRALASSKQNKLSLLEIMPAPAYQLHMKDPTVLQRASERKSSADPDAASLIAEEEIQNLVSNILSRASLSGYIEEAISTTLGYIQTGLNNESLTATEETVLILQLLDNILTQLHHNRVKRDVQISRCPRLSSLSGSKGENQLASIRETDGPRYGQLFPSINVSHMVLYSEDENEEINKIVENSLASSIRAEKSKLQEQVSDQWSSRGNAGLKHKRNTNFSTRSACPGKIAFQDWTLNSELPAFNTKDHFEYKSCLSRDIQIFSQNEKHKIQEASESIITSILAEVLQDIPCASLGHFANQNGQEASLITSEKPRGLSHQEWVGQTFSESEIHVVAQEIADVVLKILHVSSTNATKHSIFSSVHQTSLGNADVPNKEPLQTWLKSKKKMKHSAALSRDPTKHLWLESGESESTSESTVHIHDNIMQKIFNKLKSFVCPKLQKCFKPESHIASLKPAPGKKSFFQPLLSIYTNKVVKIFLDAFQKQLKYNKNQNPRIRGPPKDFKNTGYLVNTEKELDSIVTKLNNDIMTSSLVTCICEVLSGMTDESNVPLPSVDLRSNISKGTANLDQRAFSPHWILRQKEVHQCARLQLLDRIGDTLYDMLCRLIEDHLHSLPSDSEPSSGWINENLRMTTALQPEIRLISYAILEDIVTKLCSNEMNSSYTSSEFKVTSEYIDTDSLSFASLIQEMSRCFDIISSMMSNVIWQGSQEGTTNNVKTTALKTESAKDRYPHKLKAMTSDILETVFAKLKEFAKRNLKILDSKISGNKKSNNGSTNMGANAHKELLHSVLHVHTKKVSSAILRAIQSELNVSLPDLETCVHNPLQDKQMFKKLVNLILDGMPPDKFNETEPEERDFESYRYRPIYGNFLPGGAGPEPYVEDPVDTEKESTEEKRPLEAAAKSDSFEQQELQRTFKKIEVELKEPQKSPVVYIIRNILNEIFQNDLIDQLNVLSLPQSHLCDIRHAGDKPLAQTSVSISEKTMDLLVSEADVTVATDGIIRTIFQKLYSAAMTDSNTYEERYNTTTIPENLSFPENTSGRKSSAYFTTLDKNSCTLQPRFNICKMAKANVVEDIIQSVLTNLEKFVTSKVKSLSYPYSNFIVPMTLPLQQDATALIQPWLSTKDSCSDNQFCCSADRNNLGKTTSRCHLTGSKLNIYAAQLTREILQGIKHKLDEIKNPFVTHNVVSESTSQIINTVLDIVGKDEKNICDGEINPNQPEDIVEKLFNKSDYQKKLQYQILDIIESILTDICEKTLEENNLPYATSSVPCNMGGRYLEAKSLIVPECGNKTIPTILVPKSCVAMISSDMVNIVLQNLSSAIMLGINAKDSISARLSLPLYDAFPKAEWQQSPVMDPTHKNEKESFPFPRKGDVLPKSAFFDVNQKTVLKKQDTKQSAPDPYKENAHFITKTILNRLNYFITERIHLLFTLDFQTKEKSFVNYKQDDSIFLESNPMPSDVNILKILADKTILSQKVTNYTFDNHREEHGPTIHISQGILKEYADIIANIILMLVKKDIDLEIQNTYSYPNNTLLQENIFASETVNNILKNLHGKLSLNESSSYSKENSDLFTQLAVQNEILPGQRKMENNTELSLISKCPHKNQIISEEENLRRVLEEIFRHGKSIQPKMPALLNTVKEILKKVYQRVMEDIDHYPPFNELSHFTSDSKIKTIATQRKPLQSNISSVADDIVESVFEKMFSVVVISLYENNDNRRELEASGNDELPMNLFCFRRPNQAEKRSISPEPVISQVYPFTDTKIATSLETTLLQLSPVQVGTELTQMVLQKIINFIWLTLEGNPPSKSQSDEISSSRPCSSKASLKGSPRPGFIKNSKTKSKVTTLPKCGTKPQPRPSGVKSKSKTKFGTGETTLRGSQSKTAIRLQNRLSIEDAKNPSGRTKLPTKELKMYSSDIVCTILETIVNKFQRLNQNRLVNVKVLPSDGLMMASEIVNTVLQGLYATKKNLANPIKGSHLHNLKHPQKNLNTISLARPDACFSLENVSSQLERLFPKEDIFEQMFDKWQTESNDMENEKYKLVLVAKTVLNEILIKAKELEQSVSLLNLSPLEVCKSRYHNFKGASTKTEESETQINIFSQEIVEMLFEKLKLCFLNQIFITKSKETRVKSISNVPINNAKLNDKIYLGSSYQIAQEITEGFLNTFKSFADLQFKHVSWYPFPEIVKMPVKIFFAVQQKPSQKKMLPKLQPLNKFPDESKSSTIISQENIQNTFQQLYTFHSELLTYSANTVNDMLGIIKNKLDKQVEPSLVSIFEENTVTSQIINTLMEQCTHFYESLIKSHPKEYLLQGAENAYTDNWAKFKKKMARSTSQANGVSHRDDLPQTPGLVFYSEEDKIRKERASSKLPVCFRFSATDTTKTTDRMKRLKSELKPSCSRCEVQGPRLFNQAMRGNNHLPKDSVLQKLSQNSSASAQLALEHTVRFRKMEEGKDQRALHSHQIQTTVSPFEISLAAENIVNTMLLSYDLPGSPTHTMEKMKSFLESKEKALFVMSEEQKDEKGLLKVCEKRIDYKTKKENKNLEASGDFTLLGKWKIKSPRAEKSTAFKEVEVIDFMDQELGPNEIHLIARYITTSVVTHFKNFEIRGPHDEKVSVVSTLLRKKYESKQSLRSIKSGSSLNEFCEHLTELVILYIISRISNCTQDSKTRQKSSENPDGDFNKVILIHSQMFESQSICIKQLALNISEIIIQILFNSDILKADIGQQMISGKTKYIYCPRVAITDFVSLFQNLLIGVIHVLAKEIRINNQPYIKGRNKSFSMLRSHDVVIHNENQAMKRQTGPRDWKSALAPQMDQLIQKNKLDSLVCRLGTLVVSLKSHKSKILVNKIFNIALDLFFPDKCPNWDIDSGRTAIRIYPSPSNQQNHSTSRQNVGLSPKSVFFLNVVCEKLIRMLLEECTSNNSLTNDPLSNEVSAECQLFNILQNVCSPFEGYDMSDLLENLEEIDQEPMLSIISNILVKSLMEKLSHNVQQPLRRPPSANEYITYRTREKLSSFPKPNRPELRESRPGKGSVSFMSYDSKPLTGPLNNLKVICPKRQAAFGNQFPRKSLHLPPLQRTQKQAVSAIGVYSATFLEEIITGIFLNLYTSLWAKNVNITEAQLNEMNILGVNSVVNEFNNARVIVLQDIEDMIHFPSISKETVSKIVDSIYINVLWEFELQVASGNHLTHTITSIAKQITNGILIKILDYQLPMCPVKRFTPNSYYSLKAENILQKIQNNLKELDYQVQHSLGYTTMLSHSFLEDVIRKLLSQLFPLNNKPSCLGKNYLMTSDFNEISTCIINNVMLTISKHKIWLTKYDYQHVYTEKNLQNMVNSIYDNILQMSDSLASIQKSVVSQSPIIIDRMASLIIQEIIENHLQPFLCGQVLPHSRTPLDEISNMVKEVLSEVTESHRSFKTPSSLGMSFYPNAFVEEVVGRLLSKIFNPNYTTENELDKMTPKIVNSINNHFNKAKTYVLCDDQNHSFPAVDTDLVDKLVNSVYENVLKQHGLTPAVDNKELKDSDNFAENISNLIVEAISDYSFYPLFSGDLSTSSYGSLGAENIIQSIFSGISNSTKPNQHLSPYNTLLSYTFLEDIIKVLLSRIFPPALYTFPYGETPEDRSEINFSEISSKLTSDIKMKISQHEIRFSKVEEETSSLYSGYDAQHLVDSVFRNILQNSESQEVIQHDIMSSNSVLIDRIAGFIIKNICQQHLHPFVHGNLLPPLWTYCDDGRKQQFFASAYPSVFLEDVICGVLSKIFHRILGIVQTKPIRESEKELWGTAEELIYLITEEFSKAPVIILENGEGQLCLPTVDRDVILKIIDMVYSKIVQEYELGLLPGKDFLTDTKTLSKRVTKIILAEVSDFQIHPDFVAKLPLKLYSKLNPDVFIEKVRCNISKSRLQRQICTTYTTILSHTHLEKIVTQVLSQISPLDFNEEDAELLESDFSNTVLGLIDKIMSIISKHAVCISKHGNESQNMISEKDIQAMVNAIYTNVSHSNLYHSITKDKKGIHNIPVTKIASYIIKEIFSHHLQSFLPGDKAPLSCTIDQTYKHKTRDPNQRELSFIVNSAVFLEEVISELLCKILYVFSQNIMAAKNPQKATANITDIVTTLVKSIVSEFTASQILVADNLDENLYLSEGYKELVQKTVNLIFEKILDQYKSLVYIYRAIQTDVISFGQQIYYLLLGEIYNYQVEAVISGELATSSYTSLQDENIIRNVLDIINDDSHISPSCITVLPSSLVEDMIYKLLASISPSSETETELKEEEVPPEHEFVDAASKLTDEILTEISEHQIRLATAEEHAESMQLGTTENFADSVCDNIKKKFKFQVEAQKDECQMGSSFLGRIAGFIIKEIVDHHLQPFLCDKESSAIDLPENEHVIELSNPAKEKTTSLSQGSVYSVSFLEDFIIDLVRKFYTVPSIAKYPKDKEISAEEFMGMAINFANALIEEFKKSEVKVLANTKETFSFPPVDKETVDKLSDSVYEQVIEIYGPNNVQKDDGSNIEVIAALAKNAMSAFKIQPLFSGDWSSTFFAFLDVDNIIQKVQHLPYKTFTKINRSLQGNAASSPEISSTLGLKNKMDTLKIPRRTFNEKEDFQKEEIKMKKGSIHEPICTTTTSIMKNKVTTIASGLAGYGANKKKNENKKEIYYRENNNKVSNVTSPTASVKSKDTQRTALKKNEIKKKNSSSRKDEKEQGDDVYHFSTATNNITHKNVVLEQDFKIGNKKSDKNGESSLKKEDVPFELLSWEFKVKEKRTHSPTYQVTDKKILHPKHVQNVTESIYNIIEISSFQGLIDDSKSQSVLDAKTSYVTQKDAKDLVQTASTNLAMQNIPAPKEENKKCKNTDIKSKSSKPANPHNPSGKKPKTLPANFLEDVISEIVNKLIFSSSPDIDDACQNVTSHVNQDELYDAAVKLIDSLLMEFSDAQIKLLNPDPGNQSFPCGDKVSSVHDMPLRQKETSMIKASSGIKMIIVDKIPSMHRVPPAINAPSSDQIPLMAQPPSIDKMLVNKVVHSSVCSILQEYRSQDCICKDINSNSENLAKRLAKAVIEELFQNQLNLLLSDEVPSSVRLPLESKKFMKKFQKMPQTECKECQTSWPYFVMLPHEFLENIISSLLSKIFSVVANTKTEISENNTELDFLQMKLVNTVMTELSKDEHIIVQYVESLHPNDDEIIELVVQTIYNNLLPQFGSQEIIQNCVISGCNILSKTIVNLVVQEVAGNQLQTYFSGELTPHQCAEVDSVNILEGAIQTTELPQHLPPQAYKLPFNIIEEIAVNFLSKLLCMFPKVDKELPESPNDEMQKITSKILNSFQDFMSKSRIEVVPQAKESCTISLADSATIEKVVTSVYNTVLKHSGSHIAVYKDLIGKSNVLSDIIGLLMVKEISSSEFHPQVEEEPSSSELVLEAVKIMEKVVRIIDNLRSNEKPSPRKDGLLDATFLEEILALFLAKLVKLPSSSSKDAKKFSKPELNKIASQLTKSVTAEISKNNISIVAANPDGHLSPESIEITSQIVDSVYNQVLQQCGTHEELYYDMKSTNFFFPNKVASLIISKVLNCPLETISSKDSHANLFGDLDIAGIIEKAYEHAVKMDPGLEEKESDEDLTKEELPVKIIPHHRKQPIRIDPDIVAEHLGVISIKTCPLNKLQVECLARTGHSIEELRKASISGRCYSADSSMEGKKRKERRTSLDKCGRLDIKPLETASRNSFQNLTKPDISKVELLKDVQHTKDLIIRLVAHDIDQKESENKVDESETSDEDEVVLQEVVKEGFSEGVFEDQVEEDIKPIAKAVASPKQPVSRSLKNLLSFSKCCCPKASTSTSSEIIPTQLTEHEETRLTRILSKVDLKASKSPTSRDSSFGEEKTQSSVEEMRSSTEPVQFFIHRLRSSSSYNEDDLPSFTSSDEDRLQDPSAKITEENLADLDPERSGSVKFTTLFQRESILGNVHSSIDDTSDPTPSASKRGSEMMKKVSSALSKAFSRSNVGVSNSSLHAHPPSDQDRS